MDEEKRRVMTNKKPYKRMKVFRMTKSVYDLFTQIYIGALNRNHRITRSDIMEYIVNTFRFSEFWTIEHLQKRKEKKDYRQSAYFTMHTIQVLNAMTTHMFEHITPINESYTVSEAIREYARLLVQCKKCFREADDRIQLGADEIKIPIDSFVFSVFNKTGPDKIYCKKCKGLNPEKQPKDD